MSKRYIGEYYKDPLIREARKQAIIDMHELQKEYTERLPKWSKPKDRLMFQVNACVCSPKFIGKALENNIVILLPL